MIYGMHDPFPKDLMPKGWILITEGIGRDPNNHNGGDYREWSERRVEVIVRLNNGYGSAGTIPLSQYYLDFAERCAWFVKNSQGCTRWIIGNEPNHSNEWPEGIPISAEGYVRCFTLCRDLIKALVPTHEVVPAPVAPYNNQSGDWLVYQDKLLSVPCDGIALHAYTHGSDPGLITSETKMGPPFEDRYYHFRTYRDSLKRVPLAKRHLPVYITETDQDEAWENVNHGWVKEMYREVNDWNQQPSHQQIHCSILYRWPKYDKWNIDGKGEVQQDFREAQAFGYHIGEPEPPEPPIEPPPGGDDMTQFDGSFEGDVYEYDGISQLKMIAPWTPQWKDAEEGDPAWKLKRPEYGIKEARFEPEHVYQGSKSQKVHHNFATYDGGLVQGPIEVPHGAEVTYTQFCKLQSGQRSGDAHGDMQAWIGIDPTGGTDMYSDRVIWSDYIDWHSYKSFVDLTVTAKAAADRITVFCRADAKWAMDWNDAFWSYGELEWEAVVPDPDDPPDPPEPPATGSYVDIMRGDHWHRIPLRRGTAVDTAEDTVAAGLVVFEETDGSSVVVMRDSLIVARLEV